MNGSPSTAPPKDAELWTMRALVARHKLVALGLAGFIAVMVATILISLLSPNTGAVNDGTTCTQWGSNNQNLQVAYARLYVREHGSLRDGATSPASVIAAINNGCNQAYSDEVSDTTTVVQAISGDF